MPDLTQCVRALIEELICRIVALDDGPINSKSESDHVLGQMAAYGEAVGLLRKARDGTLEDGDLKFVEMEEFRA